MQNGRASVTTHNPHAAQSLPWLAGARTRLRDMLSAGRLPHGLLIQATAGLGAQILARWTVQLVMCTGATPDRPCGACKSCRQLQADTHPDLIWVQREEDARQLRVEQIRDLSAALALKSHGGGYKAAVIAEADFMNANAANALLKTLEEPPQDTLLVLCSARPSRLPATIVSRCQRLKVAAPATAQALDWLQAAQPRKDWARILEHAAGEPLRALALAGAGFADLDADMTAALFSLRERRLDLVATAERWSKADLPTRLDWLETWLTRTLRESMLTTEDLPSAGRAFKIRRLYTLLDRVRGLKLEQSTSLNMQLAAEDLLLQTQSALS
jgi:DNA polymerase-3 subunit delta'